MAKFLIFALAALFVGLAKSTESEKGEDFDQEDVEFGLNFIFNLTPDDLKKECNVDFESAWSKIGAALDKLQKFSDDFDAQARENFTDDDSRFEERVLANCRKSEPFKRERINAIKAALPCANEDRVSQLVKISERSTC